MTTLIQKIIVFTLLISILMTSCAEELTIEIPDPDQPALRSNTKLSDLMKKVSLNDGSNDNIIDNSNCFSVQLPVSVMANGTEIMVNSEDNFKDIEDIFDEFDNDQDTIQITFPITIILSNFSQIIINNKDEFENYSEDCNGENEVDDDIECLDFQYPIQASVFNSISEVTTDITINSDMELHNFIENLEDKDIASIGFPITLALADSSEITINDLEELEKAIDDAKDDCDEDDDFDYNDDDCIDCTEEQVLNILTSCNDWIVDELELNGNNLKDNYTGYTFNFANDGTVIAQEGFNSFSGTWSTSGTGLNIILALNIPTLPDFNANWTLHEIEKEVGEGKVDLKYEGNNLKFISACNE